MLLLETRNSLAVLFLTRAYLSTKASECSLILIHHCCVVFTLMVIFNRRSRVRAVVSRGSTGLIGQNTSCKAHKVCISLWPTGWAEVFCS